MAKCMRVSPEEEGDRPSMRDRCETETSHTHDKVGQQAYLAPITYIHSRQPNKRITPRLVLASRTEDIAEIDGVSCEVLDPLAVRGHSACISGKRGDCRGNSKGLSFVPGLELVVRRTLSALARCEEPEPCEKHIAGVPLDEDDYRSELSTLARRTL
ncbi:hypothetical protein BD309DRAFT_967872 [Dichomitus squalens]|nr:hypothetical protein BD309DRAFT_967872 [Dichomitus squalens]